MAEQQITVIAAADKGPPTAHTYVAALVPPAFQPAGSAPSRLPSRLQEHHAGTGVAARLHLHKVLLDISQVLPTFACEQLGGMCRLAPLRS